MARHGENIRKRKDGRWEGRYLVYSEENGEKKYRSVYGRSYEEVKEKLIEKKIWQKEQGWNVQGRQYRQRREGQEKQNEQNEQSRQKWEGQRKQNEQRGQGWEYQKELSFAEIMEEWLNEVKEKKKWSTYVKYYLICRNHLKMPFQETKLQALPEVLEREKKFSSLSDSLRKSIYCILSQILKFASAQYAVDIPILKRPVFLVRKRPIEIFSKKEQARIFSVLYQKTNRYKMAVLLCLHTGLRLGELCALKWDDVDMENCLITVNRTVQRIYAEGYQTRTVVMETTPKSEHSHREIPIPAAVLELLAQLKDGKEYIFGGDKPLEPRTMQNHFKKILKEAGVASKNFHALRHTFSTNCIEGGTDVKSLSEMLGHSDIQITLNRYVHPSMDTKRRHLDTLWSFYCQIYSQVHEQDYSQVHGQDYSQVRGQIHGQAV